MKRAAFALVLIQFAPMLALRAAEVDIVRSFPADKGPGYRKPAPDVAAAVGPHHAVVLDDRAFVVVEKESGKVVKDLTQHDFWLSVQPVDTLNLQANDPRLLYDPLSGRWIAWVQGIDPMNGYLAVSATSDPTGAWKGVKFPTPPHNYGAKAGTTYYRLGAPAPFGIAWGNYSTTCRDPSNPNLLWTCQEYANSTVDRQWCTAWVAFQRKGK